MDHRLLLAINRVIGDGDFSTAAGLASQSGPEIRKQLIKAAEQMQSGTGTPNSLLRGAARNSGVKAALGGGPKYAGGQGMVGGERVLDKADIQATLLALGVTAVGVVAQVAMEYGIICHEDRKAARRSRTKAMGEREGREGASQ